MLAISYIHVRKMHSQHSIERITMYKILTIPAFNDNYIWMIVNTSTQRCSVVDPGQAQPVLKMCASENLLIESILITHHHADHQGGVAELLQSSYVVENCQVYGPKNENIKQCSHPVSSETTPEINTLGLLFNVIDVPGHTAGHVAYSGNDWLFCGDTLFSGGCGRLFEGTASQMWNSLNKFAQLNDRTQVFCAHEYTQSNLAFALAVEPNNSDLIAYNEEVSNKRRQNQPTIPSTIAQEKRINPFLRCMEPSVISAANSRSQSSLTTPEAVLAEIRLWKDNF